MAAIQPNRQESFTGKGEVDEAQHASDPAGNDKMHFDEKQEDLDIGAQVRYSLSWTRHGVRTVN